jgi:XTP/dITP diphosphohydrolase
MVDSARAPLFTLITGNRHKLREAREILGPSVEGLKIDLDEIQGLDSDRIAECKAKAAFAVVEQPVVIWDQSLHIRCLSDFPGPLVKWFWESVGGAKICRIARALGDQGISTRTTLTYYDGSSLHHCYGEIEGAIPPEPRGSNGFAWDTIFIPQGHERTFAEMTAEEKNAISMHRLALEQLRAFLSERRAPQRFD